MNLFDNISSKNVMKLLYVLESSKVVVKKNQLFLRNIAEQNMIGFIDEGLVEVIKTDYNGNRVIVEELEENDVFGTFVTPLNGEHELLALEDSVIYIFDYDEIIKMKMDKDYYNQFVKNLLLIMNEKIIQKNNRIEILTKKSIRHKLLEYFDIESSSIGLRVFHLPFTFTELADYLAVDRSAMQRELKNLKEEGFIEVKGRKITLLYDKY